ncbi:RnfH family protein [Thalassolituus sp.]|jgi:putative ubiquitin-RnfH superfamily antitoxin RatB of RatAB toxin-antitoxin module|uniref:RnfH family protein n=1 Tax=Thalassolituus sp. TaxID=2030822 RepID=UPI0026050332|nr:RnfH family protein [uncultured Thalassolituus sp.]TNC92050.1 MAG: RnfH family protein [Thalassolituus sp.]
MAEKIAVEVAYALPQKQKIFKLQVEQGTTMLEAVKLSGVTGEFPELNLEEAKYGIFGKAVRTPDTEVLREGDRVEIYRPLIIDPKQARANRAAKAAAKEGN